MTHVDSNQHSAPFSHLVWELQVEEITSNLAVDLFQDIRGLGQIELVAVPGCHDLGGDLVQFVELLVFIIDTLITQNHK